MRRSLAGVLAAVLAGSVAVVGLVVASTSTASAATTDPHAWKNVQIEGGGFVPGIIFNQTERNLDYARMDIGGAYRWDQAGQAWIPLLDKYGWERWGYNGVVSLATDPVQTNRVYVAVAGRHLLPQHRRRRQLDPSLGLHVVP